MAMIDRNFTFATNGTVSAADLHNLIDSATIYQDLITGQVPITSVGTNYELLIADGTNPNAAPNAVTVYDLFEDALTAGTYSNANISAALTYGTATGTRLVSANATITTGTITNGVITNLASTTGTIATLNSTTGTIPTLVATTLITTGTGTAAAPAIVPTGDTNTGIFFPAADTIAFSEGGAESMRIDSSGNVGVGTASPASKLHINGGMRVTGEVSTAGASALAMDFLSGNSRLISCGSDASTQGGFSFISLNSTSSIATERLRIDSSGNVGIGTSAPANKLEIVGSFGRGAPVTKTADFSLADTENWLIVNKGSSCTVTLPAASSWTGREFTIKVITAHAVVSASSNIIPRIGGAAATAILPATDGAWATLVSNGTTWEIMCGS